MNRPILVCALFALTSAALGAQEASQSSPYEGTSNPPPDDTIITTVPVRPTPVPANRVYVQPPVPAQPATPAQAARVADRQWTDPDGEPIGQVPDGQYDAQPSGQIEPGMPPVTQGEDVLPSSVDPSVNFPDPPPVYHRRTPAASALSQRYYAADPDGDIVHPAETLRPGELAPGSTIRVRLMHRLSTAYSERGETFRTRVASDVVQGNEVLIPAGSEIDGRVVQVSRGHTGGYGTMRLRPESVIMTDGTRYRLYAEVTAAPGSGNRVQGEGTIRPGSRFEHDGVEFGVAAGGGAIAGAVVAGPVGALTGSLVGAGIVTVHLLVSHPQATLESGTALHLTLTEPLYLTPAGANISRY